MYIAHLTKKNAVFHLGERQRTAFNLLQEKHITEPILIVPDLRKPFEIECDACGDCIGAILHQDGQMFAYESHRFKDSSLLLGIYEKELLSIIHALTIWWSRFYSKELPSEP